MGIQVLTFWKNYKNSDNSSNNNQKRSKNKVCYGLFWMIQHAYMFRKQVKSQGSIFSAYVFWPLEVTILMLCLVFYIILKAFPVLCVTKSHNHFALFRKIKQIYLTSVLKALWTTLISYCVSSSRSSELPAACASCSGETPSSFGRLMAISPPGWQSKSSASRYRPHLTARWRGDSLGLCSGEEITNTAFF